MENDLSLARIISRALHKARLEGRDCAGQVDRAVREVLKHRPQLEPAEVKTLVKTMK